MGLVVRRGSGQLTRARKAPSSTVPLGREPQNRLRSFCAHVRAGNPLYRELTRAKAMMATRFLEALVGRIPNRLPEWCSRALARWKVEGAAGEREMKKQEMEFHNLARYRKAKANIWLMKLWCLAWAAKLWSPSPYLIRLVDIFNFRITWV